MKQSRNEGIGLLQELTGCRISGGKSIEVHGVQDVSINGQSNLMKEIPEWLHRDEPCCYQNRRFKQ